MALTVREMMSSEVNIIIQYFQDSTPEHLETLGVDPSRLPRHKAGASACSANARSRSSNEP